MSISSRLGRRQAIKPRWTWRGWSDRFKWLWRAPMAVLNRRPAKLNVYLQTTGLCNGRCVICPYPDSWQHDNPGSMSDELFDRLMTELAPMRLAWFCPSFQCEPMLDPKFLGRLKTAIDRLNFRLLFISTNASTLTEPMARELLDIVEPVNHEIWISFHAVGPEQYQRLMGLDYDRTMDNIVTLLKLAQGRKLSLAIHGAGGPLAGNPAMCPTHFTPQQYAEFWSEVFDRHGIKDQPLVAYFSYHDRAGELSRPEYRFGTRRRSMFGAYCMRADEWLHVLYNGDVLFCCNDYHHRTVVGNVARTPVAEVMRSPTYRAYRLMAMGLKRSGQDFICRSCCKPGFSTNWSLGKDRTGQAR